MLRKLLGATFDDARRGDDRAAGGSATQTRPSPDNARQIPPDVKPTLAKPPVLRRETTRFMALLGIFAIVYGTLMPFEVAPDARPDWTLGGHLCEFGKDGLVNILIYVPIGMFLRLIFRRRRTSGVVQTGLALIVAFALSYGTELMQTLLAARVPSWTDVLCNTAGAGIGTAMAPMVQRILRNQHAWFYHEIRRRPLSAAAAVAVVFLAIHALAPFDIQPTPAHLSRAVQQFQQGPIGLHLAMPGEWMASAKSSAITHKMACASSYGFLAFLLLLAARETGHSIASALWYGLSRSMLMVVLIEVFQLSTISHVADARDLASGWTCCVFGSLAGGILLMWRPQVHREPTVILRALLLITVVFAIGWALASVAMTGRSGVLAPVCLVPGNSQFHRPWDSVIADYTTSGLRYAILAGLFALWCRSTHRRPRRLWIAGAATAGLAFTITMNIMHQHPIDTAQFLLAGLAAVIVIRLDLALFEEASPIHPISPRPKRTKTLLRKPSDA